MDWYIGKEWQEQAKGIHKKVLSLQFSRVDKPEVTSQVVIKVENIAELGARPSKYLADDLQGEEQTVALGTARTPVDCYIELLLQQMCEGETAACSIATKNADETIRCQLTLVKIVSGKAIHLLNMSEIHALALLYKENGVAMFKEYPKFAHDYFTRAAKILISCKPFNLLTEKTDGIDGKNLQTLFTQVQTNLAACLLNAKRYEDVIYQTDFVESTEAPSEKSVYRRAQAFYHLKEYEKAQHTIERLPNYEENKDFAKLRENIAASWKDSNVHYKEIVQRMFS